MRNVSKVIVGFKLAESSILHAHTKYILAAIRALSNVASGGCFVADHVSS
jgi:hypothetical protein